MTGQMGNEPLISVIVPIYKVEEYLPYCMESILSQSYGNLEIILVDDGSPDKSGAMAEEYAKKDRRVKCFHKENGGLSDARNFGLSNMTGEYVTFIDSDDYIRADFIGCMYQKLVKDASDLVICMEKKTALEEDYRVVSPACEASSFDGEQLKELMLSRRVPMYAHGKLFKASLFDGVNFPVGRLFEDICTIWRIINKVARVSVIFDRLYFYRMRAESIVNAQFKPQRMDQLYFSEDILGELKPGSRLFYLAQSRCFFAACDILTYVTKDYPKDARYLKNAIKKYRGGVLKDKTAEGNLKLMSLMSYVSIGLVRRVGLLYKKRNEKQYAK